MPIRLGRPGWCTVLTRSQATGGAETALKVAYLRGVNFYMILVCGMYYIRISTIITYDKQLAGRSDRLQLLMTGLGLYSGGVHTEGGAKRAYSTEVRPLV